MKKILLLIVVVLAWASYCLADCLNPRYVVCEGTSQGEQVYILQPQNCDPPVYFFIDESDYGKNNDLSSALRMRDRVNLREKLKCESDLIVKNRTAEWSAIKWKEVK